MNSSDETKAAEAIEEAFRRIGDMPSARYAMRRPSTPEEAARWEAEGVIVNPSSLDAVVEEAHRRYARDKAAQPSPDRGKKPGPQRSDGGPA